MPEKAVPKSKGTYECVLKWRAKEFMDTKILNVSVHDGKGSNESAMVVSTKDGQILVVNLYQQVYFPDYIKMMQDIKSDDPFGADNSHEDSKDLDGSGYLAESGKSVLGSLDARPPKAKARTVGLIEEGSDDI